MRVDLCTDKIDLSADIVDLSMSCLQAKAGITDDIIEVLTTTSAELSKGRRKRPMPAGLASAGTIEQYGLLSSHPLHKTSEVSFSFFHLVMIHLL